ncbi:MAG: hypothetical protein IJS19_01515 [Muribaculaceae bacterium]|nr:hypothetical protein [Muribaculaceae bacterium]
MATDIWVHAEYRKGKSKQYHHIAEFDCDRIYGIFALLAGVRLNIPPLFELKGLPGDISRITLEAYRDGKSDFHHMSWLSTSELEYCINVGKDILKKECEKDGEPYNEHCFDSYIEVLDYLKEYENIGEPARIVFWFDN